MNSFSYSSVGRISFSHREKLVRSKVTTIMIFTVLLVGLMATAALGQKSVKPMGKTNQLQKLYQFL